jgi:thioredoxin-dependent peroxiredoxin
MLGKPVPDFSLASTGRSSSPGTFNLSALRGEKLSFYFFHSQFRRAGARVFGISRDSAASHERFKEKMRFPFELLSDPDEALCEQFAVMKLKNMYRKKVRGITRSCPRSHGALALEWRAVKVPGHAQEVSNFVKAL